MNDRLPDNLALLYETFGQKRINDILPGATFDVDGVEFVCKYSPESTATRFYIVKTLELVERYRELCQRFVGANIFELGIAEGGSTALLALLSQPRKLIAVDLEPKPVPALSEFIAARRLHEVVRPFYGVDQADTARLTDIADAELADEPLDLVFDDASHRLDETRASFETLFPRLRPGGLFLIEDWQADHSFLDGVASSIRDKSAPDHEELLQRFRESLVVQQTSPPPRKAPLTQLAVELMLARASWGTVAAIDEVTVSEFWLTVRRGPGELDPATFRLADLYTDYFGFLP